MNSHDTYRSDTSEPERKDASDDFDKLVVLLGLGVFSTCMLIGKILPGLLAAGVFFGVAFYFNKRNKDQRRGSGFEGYE